VSLPKPSDRLVRLRNGGAFGSPLTATIANQLPPSVIVIGDFDADGKADLVTGAFRFQPSDNTVAFVKGHGDAHSTHRVMKHSTTTSTRSSPSTRTATAGPTSRRRCATE
jgi:hypothetical protein